MAIHINGKMRTVCVWIWMTSRLRELTELITRHKTQLLNTCLKVTDEYSSWRRRILTASATGTLLERSQTVWAHPYSVAFYSTCVSRSNFGSWGWSLKKKKMQLVKWISTLFKLRTLVMDLTEIFWVCDVIVDVFSQHGCSFNKHYCQTLPRLLSCLFWSRERRDVMREISFYLFLSKPVCLDRM